MCVVSADNGSIKMPHGCPHEAAPDWEIGHKGHKAPCVKRARGTKGRG